MSTYYLEYSEEEASGTSHKFYEATVDGDAVTLSYGRIGTPGTSTSQQCDSPEAAEKLALKKVNEKKRKGYQEAVKGVRQKRTMTHRVVESRAATTKTLAPTLWRFKTGSSAFGVFVDQQGCWVGNQAGRVYRLSHEGEVQLQYQLSEGVKCIVSDGSWMYVGCDDGNVYDLSGKTPRLAYEINPRIDIYWLDIANGLLAVSDAAGQLTTVNYEDEEQWSVKTGATPGWCAAMPWGASTTATRRACAATTAGRKKRWCGNSVRSPYCLAGLMGSMLMPPRRATRCINSARTGR